MKLLSKNFSKASLIILIFVFTNCFKDDEHNRQEIQLKEQNVHGVMEDASKYPHVLNYLRQKTNGTFQYSILETKITPSSAYMRTEEFGTINTTETVMINEDEKSKYSFKVEDPNNLNEFVNLIVVEKEGSLQDFFIKYTPTSEWLEQQGEIPDMATFSGNMMIYNFSGELTNDLTFTDGVSSGDNSNPFPCPDDTQDEGSDDTEDDNSGDGSSGGAGDPDWSDGTVDEGDYDGNTHGGSGAGGGGCIVQVVFVPCSCESDGGENCNTGPHSADECGVGTGAYYTINMFGDGCRTTAPTTSDNDETEPDPCDPGEVGIILDLDEPCRDIAEQIADEDYSAKLATITNSSNFNSQDETGFSEETDGTYTDLSPNVGQHSLSMPVLPGRKGFTHVHTNPYEIPDQNGDGIPDETIPIKQLSPGDIISFLRLLILAKEENRPASDVYGTMYSSSRDYTLRFTGGIDSFNITDVNELRSNLANLDAVYTKTIRRYGKERGFLKFVEAEIGVSGISLYRIKNNGTIQKKFLNENGGLKTEDCE